jgi:hypothetical protein
MALLAEKRFEQIGFGDIRARAGVIARDCARRIRLDLSILAAHMKELDRKVLAGERSDMAEEPPRERLFDVLMRRIEAMAPYREATRSLMKSASCNPGLAFALNGLAVRSQTWMMTAAGIDAAGPARHDPRAGPRRRCLPQCCAPGWMTRTKARRARWRRSTARSHAGNAGPACSTICAASRRAAVCAGAAARATRKSRPRLSTAKITPALLTVARNPPIGLSPSAISPPCERAMSRAIARPRPVPLVLIARIVEPQERAEHLPRAYPAECPARRHPP